MKLRCQDFRKKLDAMKQDLESFKTDLLEFEKTGDDTAGNIVAIGRMAIEDELDRFKDDIEYMSGDELKEFFGPDGYFGYEDAKAVFNGYAEEEEDWTRSRPTRKEILALDPKQYCLIYTPRFFIDENGEKRELALSQAISKVSDHFKKNKDDRLVHLQQFDFDGFWNNYRDYCNESNRRNILPKDAGWNIVQLLPDKDTDLVSYARKYDLDSMVMPSTFDVITSMLISKRVFEWMKKQERVLWESRALDRAMKGSDDSFHCLSNQVNPTDGKLETGIVGRGAKGDIPMSTMKMFGVGF